MGAYVELASLTIMLAFLAVVLSAIGWGASKLLHSIFDARRQKKMKAEALVAAASSRARARAAARAA
jgi:hypothetical protein